MPVAGRATCLGMPAGLVLAERVANGFIAILFAATWPKAPRGGSAKSR